MDYELMMNGNVKIGQKAPEFTATTTFGEISLKDYEGKWLVLFSHPRRFYTSLYDRNDSIYKCTSIF
jgi:peroxiredoxin